MRKKIVFLFIVLLIFLGFKTQQNLIYYSVYYAQNMPHDPNKNPTLIFTLKNLFYIQKPSTSKLKYDFDGTNTIIFNEEYYITNSQTPYIAYFTTTDFRGTHFYFDKIGQLDYILIDYNETPINQQMINSAENLVNQAIQPIIEVQPEPEVNLQWLFNLIYQRQFE